MIDISTSETADTFPRIYAPRGKIVKSFEFLKANIEVGHVVFTYFYLATLVWYKVHADGEIEYAYSACEPYRHLGIITSR